MIPCVYTCGSCGVVDAVVDVAERDPARDVVAWFREVLTPALVADHRRRSPLCRATSLAEVRVPVPAQTEHVGVLPPKN